jgi:hypothetical protein
MEFHRFRPGRWSSIVGFFALGLDGVRLSAANHKLALMVFSQSFGLHGWMFARVETGVHVAKGAVDKHERRRDTHGQG